MKKTLLSCLTAIVAVSLTAPIFAQTAGVPLGSKNTDWLNRDRPGGTGDWENTSALAVAECRFVAAPNQIITTANNPGYTCDINTGSVCRNTAALACQDTEVRFVFDDKLGKKHTTLWMDRDDPSGDGDWEHIKDLLKVECRFTGTTAPVPTNVTYRCGLPDSRSGGSGVNGKGGVALVQDIEVRYSYPY